jgi:hypothetical protein
MKTNLIAALGIVALTAAGCASGGSTGSTASGLSPSPSGASPALDADCNPIQPSHTPACDQVRAQIADLDDQIETLRRSIEGPPRLTGPELGDVNRRIRELEAQKNPLAGRLASCDGRNVPRRRNTPDVNDAFLMQTVDPAATLTVAPPVAGVPPDGVLTQALSGREFVLTFTGNGCRVNVIALPTGRFKKTGFPRDFSLGAAAGSSGTFHPVSGKLDLHIVTTLGADVVAADAITFDLTTTASGGRNVDASGNMKLVMARPLALDRSGHLSRALSLETVSFTFEGRLSSRPAQ